MKEQYRTVSPTYTLNYEDSAYPETSIRLPDGNIKFPGFEKRLYQELTGLFDEKTPIKVKALPNRELLGWIGGARLSNLSSFQRFWLTKADYQENGPVLVQDNSKLFEDIKNSNSELTKTA